MLPEHRRANVRQNDYIDQARYNDFTFSSLTTLRFAYTSASLIHRQDML